MDLVWGRIIFNRTRGKEMVRMSSRIFIRLVVGGKKKGGLKWGGSRNVSPIKEIFASVAWTKIPKVEFRAVFRHGAKKKKKNARKQKQVEETNRDGIPPLKQNTPRRRAGNGFKRHLRNNTIMRMGGSSIKDLGGRG